MEYRLSLRERPDAELNAERLKLCDEDIQILRSMFDNFEVRGTTEDGHTFHFNDNGIDHSTLVIDGVAAEEPGIMYTGKSLDELQVEDAELRYE